MARTNIYFDQLRRERTKQRIQRSATERNEVRDREFCRVILSIPSGKVSTYGKVAAAAGYPRLHRAVARLLRVAPEGLPWHRVVGAGGAIKLRDDAAQEQRARLRLEGVVFRADHVNMEECEWMLRPWESE